MNERQAMRKILRENPGLAHSFIRAYLEGRLKDTDSIPDGAEATIVCGPDHCGIEGSKQVKCECGTLVWMSPSMQETQKARGSSPMRLMCFSCFRKEAENLAKAGS